MPQSKENAVCYFIQYQWKMKDCRLCDCVLLVLGTDNRRQVATAGSPWYELPPPRSYRRRNSAGSRVCTGAS